MTNLPAVVLAPNILGPESLLLQADECYEQLDRNYVRFIEILYVIHEQQAYKSQYETFPEYVEARFARRLRYPEAFGFIALQGKIMVYHVRLMSLGFVGFLSMAYSSPAFGQQNAFPSQTAPAGSFAHDRETWSAPAWHGRVRRTIRAGVRSRLPKPITTSRHSGRNS